LLVNEFLYLEADRPFHAQVKEASGKWEVLQTLKDYGHQRHNVWGITARNREQNFALNLLLNPQIDFVTLLGQAGTGKTLLTLATGLTQVLEQKIYSEIIMTRVTVPVGEDIGFLPGTEEEKMNPWMGALEDNLDVLNKTDDEAGEGGRAATRDLIRSRIKVKSLNFMRGRTFINKFLIIDEAQNLTPKQMKTMITRAGPGTKVVCLGNIEQIDTPYLTEGSSGITYVVDRFKGWAHSGHVTLQRGERSRLAHHAGEILHPLRRGAARGARACARCARHRACEDRACEARAQARGRGTRARRRPRGFRARRALGPHARPLPLLRGGLRRVARAPARSDSRVSRTRGLSRRGDGARRRRLVPAPARRAGRCDRLAPVRAGIGARAKALCVGDQHLQLARVGGLDVGPRRRSRAISRRGRQACHCAGQQEPADEARAQPDAGRTKTRRESSAPGMRPAGNCGRH